MSHRFTPAPWIAHEELLTPGGLHVAGRSPSVRKGQHVIAGVGRFLNHRLNENVCLEAEANAVLIAAAPELYGALEQLVREYPNISEDAIAKAQAVLRKAVTR